MLYLGLGVLLLLVGYSLITGDSGSTPLGSKIPINFGEYGKIAGAIFFCAGAIFAWLGVKYVRKDESDD